MQRKIASLVQNMGYFLLLAVAFIATLVVSRFFWTAQSYAFAIIAFASAAIMAWVYLNKLLYNYRFIFPALLALGVIVVIPIGITVAMSLSNYSNSNLLRYVDAKKRIDEQTYVADEGISLRIYGWQDDKGIHLYLQNEETDQWLEIIDELGAVITQNTIVRANEVASVPEQNFDKKIIFQAREALSNLTVKLDNNVMLSKDSIKLFSERKKRFQEIKPYFFSDSKTGNTVEAILSTGLFTVVESADPDQIGTFISPSFFKTASLQNYRKLLTDTDQLRNVIKVFSWTVFSATFTVTVSFLIALTAASLLNWQAIREREIYRFMIVACYAFPAFAIVTSFVEIFSTDQRFWGAVTEQGTLNRLLDYLFNIEADWMFDPILARVKFLIVQFWMFMPFMFIMCLGVIQSIPKSLYEAATMEGAGVRSNFIRITLPLTFMPLAPVLIIAFATAFNDLSLVNMLSVGFPDIQGSVPRAGHTDLLVSYANYQSFGMPFERAVTADYSLASTLFTMIFMILGGLSLIYMRLVKTTENLKGI